MAQIIKHKRGSLEKLSSVTGSLQKGELVIATGSVKLGNVTNGQALVFAAYESGAVSATNRILRGDVAPIFSASTYNGMLDGVPFYASASNTLFLLGSDENEAIDLTGNISEFSSSVSASISNLSSSIQSVTGDFSSSVATSFSASAFTVSQLSASVASDLSSLSGSLTASIGETQTSITNLSSSVNNISGAFATTTSASKAEYTSFSASAASDLNSLSGSLTASIGSTQTSITNLSSSVASDLSSVSGAFATSTSASNAAITSLSASVASVTGDFSSSVATSFSASNASIASLSASVASVTGDFSSSVATSFSASTFTVSELSKSIALTDNAQSDRLNTLESSTGSYALLSGSNIFYGNQVITGSVFVSANLVVQGSSSLQNITASAVSIGTNTIILNTDTPAVRYAGISVFDSGSTDVTASLFYDGLTNNWKFQHDDIGTNDASIVLFGPLGSDLDTAPTLTGNFVTKVEDNGHGHHLTTSSIQDNGTKVTIYNPLDVTGEISSSTIVGIGNVTLYSQSVDSRVASLESSVGAGGAIGTRVSNLETISSSYLAFTQSYYSDSSSFDTRISASKAEYTSYSASAATSFSASAFTTTINSASAASELNSVSGAVATTITNLSSSIATTDSASAAFAASQLNSVSGAFVTTITNLSSSIATTDSASAAFAASQLNSVSGAVATTISNLSSSIATTDSASAAFAASQLNSVSGAFATSTSASAAFAASELNSVSGAVATTISNLSSSVATSFSASAASQTVLSSSISSDLNTLSSSVDGRLDTLEASLGGGGEIGTRVANLETISASYLSFTQSYYSDSSSFDTRISASKVEYTLFSASAATAISASNAAQLELSTSVDSRLDEEEFKSTTFATTGSNVFIGDQTITGSINVKDESSTFSLSGNGFGETYLTSYNGTIILEAQNGGVVNVKATDLTVDGTISGSSIVGLGNATEFSTSVDSRFSASAYNVAELSASVASDLSSVSGAFATSTSASNAAIATLSASVASTTGDFSSSIATQFSASTFTVSNLSSSVYLTDKNQTDRIVVLETSQSAFDTAFELSGSSVTILGDFTIRGTQTIVDSTTVQIGDNIIELNGSSAANGGLYVKDVTAPNTATGSLIWDSTNDYWKAGAKDNEYKVLLAVGDSVVSSSTQIDITSTTGFSTFDTAISTSFSASAYNVASLSASVASVTGDFSSSVATSFSASAFTTTQLSASIASDLNSVSGAFATSTSASNAAITSLSASVASVTGDFSSSVATSFSASAFNLNELSASIYLTDATQSTDITNNSSSFATEVSASNFRITILETTIDGGSY
jgi:hypothetical protein